MDQKISPYRTPSRWVAVIVAVTACAAGFTIALYLSGGPRSPAAAAGGSPSPSASANSPGALPPLSGNGAGGLRIELTGKVLAVSRTSITIGGDGPSVTARLTGSTRVTGEVTNAAGIRVGDEISAQLTGASTSSLTAAAIQDPA